MASTGGYRREIGSDRSAKISDAHVNNKLCASDNGAAEPHANRNNRNERCYRQELGKNDEIHQKPCFGPKSRQASET